MEGRASQCPTDKIEVLAEEVGDETCWWKTGMRIADAEKRMSMRLSSPLPMEHDASGRSMSLRLFAHWAAEKQRGECRTCRDKLILLHHHLLIDG
jgi:hypothetical protein